MGSIITNREKDFSFLRCLSLFGGCCTLKGFEFYHGYSSRHAKREISNYLHSNILDTVKFSDNEYLRSRGIGNIYAPKRKISKIFNVNRKISTDPEKIILRNLRFLTACSLYKKGIKPISFYEIEDYFKIINLDDNLEFIKYVINSNMEDLVTNESICICFPTIWSMKKCFNTILFWQNIIKDYNLKLYINIFSTSNSFNEKIKNMLGFSDIKIFYNEIVIDNFEKNYTNYLINRDIDSTKNENEFGNILFGERI
jgi:hypothetical protein